MEKNLNWAEFAPSSKADWERAAEKALKGKSAEEWLVKVLGDGLRIPSYTDATDVDATDAIPGKAPWTRGIRRDNNDWTIVQEFGNGREELSNARILSVLNEGVSGLKFGLEDASALEGLLKDVWVGILDTQIHSHTAQIPILRAFSGLAKKQDADPSSLRYGVLTDPFPMTGASESSLSGWIEASRLAASLPGVVRTTHIDVRPAGNVNAPASFQLAIAMAKGHEALLSLLEAGLSVDAATAMMQFSFATGPDHLTEIAKYRSFRVLWHQVVSQYAPEHGCSTGTFVHAESCKWNKSTRDRYNNLLRGTIEAMSAILGGADSVLTLPADIHSDTTEKLSERWSRNIQFMLRDESFLHRVADPAGGSWYVEKEGRMLANDAWKRFQEIESKGGYKHYWTSGRMQADLEEYGQSSQHDLNSGKIRWIGVNKYPSPESAASSNEFENALAELKKGEA